MKMVRKAYLKGKDMKPCLIGVAIFPLLLCAQPSVARTRDTPYIAALRKQAEDTAAAAQKNREDQNDYISALQTYKSHLSKTPKGDEQSLYTEYKALLSRYTATITFFWPVNPGDTDPHLPVVAFPAGPVTVEAIKTDYLTMAHDYRSVLKDYTTGVNRVLPPELPPLPPLRSTDKDAQKLASLEKTLNPALQAAVNSRALPHERIGEGWVAHNGQGRGQSGQEQCYRPIGSGPDGVIMGMGPCN